MFAVQVGQNKDKIITKECLRKIQFSLTYKICQMFLQLFRNLNRDRNFCVDMVDLEHLISIFNVGTFKFEDQCLISISNLGTFKFKDQCLISISNLGTFKFVEDQCLISIPLLGYF